MADELVIREQKVVYFYEDELLAIRGNDNNVYVSLRHLCEALGLNPAGQIQRIQRTNILEQAYRLAQMNQAGGRRQVSLLRADMVPLWLAGISTKAVREDVRPRLEKYQAEAAKVLWEAFQEGRLTSEPSFESLLESDSPAVQAYKIAKAVVDLARNQILLESRLSQRLEQQEALLASHEQRLEQLEAQTGDPGRNVSPEQASQISQAVKTIAMLLSQKSGRNEYGGVYGALSRKFGITGYKLLPARRFQEAVDFLNEWHNSLSSHSPF